jgi:UDP-4-amino-4,6-dideoxy-N-acetyl-beta-L-altrosamine transaminase
MTSPKFIPYSRQWIGEEDISEVIDVLRSDLITQGPRIKEFEEKLALYCGAQFAVAVSTGTAALHLACLAAGIGEGDEVITSPITFLASANSILYCGGKPVFADIDPQTYNVDVAAIKKSITSRTKGIIPVHFAGQPCEMEEIEKIARQNNLVVIEDSCHALGSEYKGFKTGGCQFSDMAIFSFHPVKHIATGEGGAVLTNNPELYKKLQIFRNHGVVKEPQDFLQPELGLENGTSRPNPWYYEMQQLGYNFRITDMQCALGISQLKKLDRFVARRRELVDKYNRAFQKKCWITIPKQSSHVKSSYHLYVIQMEFDKIGKTRAEVMFRLSEKGIGSQVHYIPIPWQPFYRKKYGYKPDSFLYAKEYYNKTLSLPLFPSLEDNEIDYVIDNIIRLHPN